MKKQILFLAFIATSVIGCNAGSKEREKGAELPSERTQQLGNNQAFNKALKNLKMQFKEDVHNTLNDLQNMLATQFKGKRMNLAGTSREWNDLVRNLDIYAKQYSTTAQRTLSTIGRAVFNTIKDTYKELNDVQAQTNNQKAARDQNRWDFLDQVLRIVRLNNQGKLQPLNY